MKKFMLSVLSITATIFSGCMVSESSFGNTGHCTEHPGRLQPGVYLLKMVNSRNGEITSRKIIVN